MAGLSAINPADKRQNHALCWRGVLYHGGIFLFRVGEHARIEHHTQIEHAEFRRPVVLLNLPDVIIRCFDGDMITEKRETKSGSV